MASALMRRSVLTAALAAAATIASPVLAIEGVAHAAGNPALVTSFPAVNATLVDGSQTLSATYDQQIAAPPASTFTVYEIVNGTRQNSLSGVPTLSASTLGGANDTINFKPTFALQPTNEYEAVIHVDGVVDSKGADNPAASTTTDFFFWVDNRPPQNPHGPQYINNVNDTAVPFSGTAAPGLKVTVSIMSSASPSGPALASGSSAVPTCASAPNCPWNVNVDLSKVGDGTYVWSAAASDAGGKATDATAAQTITRDTTAPNKPTISTAQFTDPTDGTLNVAATDSSTDVSHWIVTVTDVGSAHTAGPLGYNGSSLNANIPVASLDDGQLTVTVVAQDGAGNQSSGATANVTKDTGLALDFAHSTFTNNVGDVTFPAAEARATQTPNTMTLQFSQPVEPSWQDLTTPSMTTYRSNVCIRDTLSGQPGNCVIYSNTPDISSDGRTMTVAIPTQLADSGSPYTIEVTAYSKNLCPNRTPQNTQPSNTWKCETLSGTVTTPSNLAPYIVQDTVANSTAEFVFDSTPPAAPTVSMPSVVDANNIGGVTVAGTAEPGSNVVVSVRSSGGGSLLLANPGGTRVGNDGQWAFDTSLRSLPDGALTVLATATDAAGNTSTAGQPTNSPVLQARPTAPQNLSVIAGNGGATLAWTAPASTGGHPLSGYSLSVTDTSVPGTAPQSFSINGGTGQYAVSNLLNGHAYSFSLVAANDIGSGPAATAGATPKGNTALSVGAPRIITFGGSVALRGRLTYLGAGVGGEALSITPIYYNGAHGGSLHATTDAYGNWALYGIRPAKNVTYVATFAGDGAYNGSSAAARVLVRVLPKITKVAAKSKSHLSAVTLQGRVAPNQAGGRVYIYEQQGKRQIRLASVTLTRSSTWSYSRKFGTGTHYVFVRFYSRNGNQGNDSSKVKFTRS